MLCTERGCWLGVWRNCTPWLHRLWGATPIAGTPIRRGPKPHSYRTWLISAGRRPWQWLAQAHGDLSSGCGRGGDAVPSERATLQQRSRIARPTVPANRKPTPPPAPVKVTCRAQGTRLHPPSGERMARPLPRLKLYHDALGAQPYHMS